MISLQAVKIVGQIIIDFESRNVSWKIYELSIWIESVVSSLKSWKKWWYLSNEYTFFFRTIFFVERVYCWSCVIDNLMAHWHFSSFIGEQWDMVDMLAYRLRIVLLYPA